jgi:hypothetical protein
MDQTAVEWLEKELSEYLYFQLISSENKDKRNVPIDTLRLNGMFNQAKEMEKQQITDAHGMKKDYSFSQIDPQIITGEQYYNETFKNTKK